MNAQRYFMQHFISFKICGGLDVFAIDVLHGKDGKDYILEMNDTANGLDFRYEKEDLQSIKEVVIEKMNSFYFNSNGKSS